ncbi:hypothetical protein ACVFI8_20005 [Agarivorans sp. MS3-6]|uniref:hypothetical protein n=1 Tax=Agarivorans sp. TSD2052 TaxID=2937286 RepID=UPI00200CFC88|nr:hypothetical protein [Agarivorans sp. TSD2052]UPW16881.1 hypothetical protein M0C34_11550 [Agarivorans sp. TSD2052]
MSDPHWTSYVGMVTGIVGSIAGITGAIVASLSLKKTREIKALDLRLTLKKNVNEFRSLLIETEELLPKIDNSRKRVFSATGKLGSGERKKWEMDFEKDTDSLEVISNTFQRAEKDLDTESYNGLEHKLDSLNQLKYRLDSIYKKYSDAYQDDEKTRARIKDFHGIA